jgi:hypothetical protein
LLLISGASTKMEPHQLGATLNAIQHLKITYPEITIHQFLKVGGSFFSLREAIFEMWAEWAIGFTRKLMVLGQGIFHRFFLVHFDLGKLLLEVIW